MEICGKEVISVPDIVFPDINRTEIDSNLKLIAVCKVINFYTFTQNV